MLLNTERQSLLAQAQDYANEYLILPGLWLSISRQTFTGFYICTSLGQCYFMSVCDRHDWIAQVCSKTVSFVLFGTKETLSLSSLARPLSNTNN